MLSRLRNMFGVPDLRNKIIFTLIIIGVYRIGAHLPVPFIDFNAIKDLQKQSESTGVVGFLDLFSGGAITNVAIFFLGIMPYITASIIMQLLGVVIPKLEEWQNEGQVGQKKITQWTRYLTVGLALVQSTGFVFALHQGSSGLLGFAGFQGRDLIPGFNTPRAALIVLTWTAGTALGRQPGDDRREDQDRHAVADPPLGDQLAEPHDHRGAGGPREDDEPGAPRRERRDQLGARGQ